MTRRIHDRELLDTIETIDPIMYDGPAWRVSLQGRSPTQGSTRPGRWSDGSFEALYTSLEADTAKAEMRFHLFEKSSIIPSRLVYMLSELQIELGRCLKLLDITQLETLGVESDVFYGRSFQRVVHELYPTTQAIGAAASFLGFDGLQVPSARAKGSNMVLLLNNLSPEREIEVKSTAVADWNS